MFVGLVLVVWCGVVFVFGLFEVGGVVLFVCLSYPKCVGWWCVCVSPCPKCVGWCCMGFTPPLS